MLGSQGGLNRVGAAVSNALPRAGATLNLDFTLGTLDSRITFTRASSATFFDSAGVLQTAASGAARFTYDPATLQPQGLLIEEQRTNSIRNNTMQGAVAGTPGTDPTNWVVPAAGGNLTTKTIVGVGTESGITYVDVQLVASGAVDVSIYPEAANVVTASNGQNWSVSSYVKLVGGSVTNLTTRLGIVENDSGGNFLAGGATIYTPSSSALAGQRITFSRTNTNASTAFVQPRFRFEFSGAGDITLRIGLPQLELGAFATSVIPTTTTALTRNADVAEMTGTNFSSWYNASEGTLYVDFQWTTATPRNNSPLFRFDDETNNNFVQLGFRNVSPTAPGAISLRLSGGTTYETTTGTVSTNDGLRHKFAGAYTASELAFSADAQTAGTATPAGVPVVNVARIGALNTGVATNYAIYIRRIAYYPTRLSNAQLQALTG